MAFESAIQEAAIKEAAERILKEHDLAIDTTTQRPKKIQTVIVSDFADQVLQHPELKDAEQVVINRELAMAISRLVHEHTQMQPLMRKVGLSSTIIMDSALLETMQSKLKVESTQNPTKAQTIVLKTKVTGGRTRIEVEGSDAAKIVEQIRELLPPPPAPNKPHDVIVNHYNGSVQLEIPLAAFKQLHEKLGVVPDTSAVRKHKRGGKRGGSWERDTESELGKFTMPDQDDTDPEKGNDNSDRRPGHSKGGRTGGYGAGR